MVQKDITMKPGSWLQAKSAAGFIQEASRCKASIWVEKDGKKANAKSLLGLMALEISPGSVIRLTADGVDEETAVVLLGDYMLQNV